MPSALSFALLALALVLPVAGALALRLLGPRMTERQFYTAALALFCVAVASVIALARSPLAAVQIGGLALLTPAGAAADVPAALPPDPPDDAPPDDAPPDITPTSEVFLPLTESLSASEVLTGTQTAYPEPTGAPPAEAPAPTEEPAPTEVPPTEVPPTEEPAPTEAPPAQRTYTVQPGDTLRGIAEQLGVSVEALLEANNLTPEEADSLQLGQELVVP